MRMLRERTLYTQMCTSATISAPGGCVRVSSLTWDAVPLGDTIAQHGIEGKTWREHDVNLACLPHDWHTTDDTQWRRTGRFSFYGGFMWAPLSYNWHRVRTLTSGAVLADAMQLLNRVAFDAAWKSASFPRRVGSSRANIFTAVPARVVLDMSIFAPFANLFFLCAISVLCGDHARVCSVGMGYLEGKTWPNIADRIRDVRAAPSEPVAPAQPRTELCLRLQARSGRLWTRADPQPLDRAGLRSTAAAQLRLARVRSSSQRTV
jgi:hypothetical protein